MSQSVDLDFNRRESVLGIRKFKIIVIGDEGVGKTQLIEAFKPAN